MVSTSARFEIPFLHPCHQKNVAAWGQMSPFICARAAVTLLTKSTHITHHISSHIVCRWKWRNPEKKREKVAWLSKDNSRTFPPSGLTSSSLPPHNHENATQNMVVCSTWVTSRHICIKTKGDWELLAANEFWKIKKGNEKGVCVFSRHRLTVLTNKATKARYFCEAD